MKKFSVSGFYFFLAGLLSLAIIQGCEQADLDGNSGNGTLKIVLSDKMNKTKTIEPSISMTIASYDITGTCSGQADVSRSNINVSEGSVEFDGLASGSWTFTVTGRNSAGTAIGSGQKTVEITQGVDEVLEVTVTPLQGNGILQLNASWIAGSLANPVLTGKLTLLDNDTDQSNDVEFTSFTMLVSGNTAAYSNSAIPAGYYLLSVNLTDGTYSTGACYIIRIAAGYTSSGNITPAVNNHGVIAITITQQMNDPVIVALANTASTITRSTSMTVTASASNASAVTYYWYIDGVSVTGTTSCTINGSSLTVGQHRLDVIAITSDSARAGSTSHVFTVTQ